MMVGVLSSQKQTFLKNRKSPWVCRLRFRFAHAQDDASHRLAPFHYRNALRALRRVTYFVDSPWTSIQLFCFAIFRFVGLFVGLLVCCIVALLLCGPVGLLLCVALLVCCFVFWQISYVFNHSQTKTT